MGKRENHSWLGALQLANESTVSILLLCQASSLMVEHPPRHNSALQELSRQPNKQGRSIRKPSKKGKQRG